MERHAENSSVSNDKEIINTLLTDTFNSILHIEERSLNNRLMEGLSIAELHTIAAVGLYEQNPMKVIASRLGITLATLTVAITKLEKKGFVERLRSEIDRRQVLVKLTTKGRKAYRAHDAFHKKLVDTTLEELTPEEEVVFVRAIAKVKHFFDDEYAAMQQAAKEA